MDIHFHCVAVDLIGPITPVSDNGNIYFLTIVDFATKYPEAVALSRIETERVAEALHDVFSRVVFPTEILSDKGSQFTSDLIDEDCIPILLKQLFTTPYNPKCNILCERLNGVLKSMWNKMGLTMINLLDREKAQGGTSFVDLLCFFSVLCLLCLCARLFICAL